MRELLDGEHRLVREGVRGVLRRPEFVTAEVPPPTEEYRKLILERARLLSDTGGTRLGFPAEFGGFDMVGGSIAAFETLAHSDLSLLVKCGVQFGLFGGSVLHLGTRKHHEKYLSQITSLELPGAFGMSESFHGSNVQEVRTTATYDVETGEFIVNTPTEHDSKDWIGGAARDARLCTVFAQLIIGGESKGVHALLVPLRDEDGDVVEGVRIEDCGEKMGLNGVDNGRIWFDHKRVERDALLDRYAEVTEAGEYKSRIENPNRRFFTMLGTLIQGRVAVGGAAQAAAKSALTIAIRYGDERRQFGPPDSDEEALLLDYRVHQRRLLPRLAKSYALHFAQRELVDELDRIFGGDVDDEDARRELETRAAGYKALGAEHAIRTIQVCRECCGGQGYLRKNRFAELAEDMEIFSTFEGDNTILLQLVAKSLLTGYREEFGELNPIGIAGFVGKQVWETVVERSAARELIQRLSDDLTPGRESEGDLLDRDYQLGLLRWRAEHVLSGAARRLKGGFDQGRDLFELFNECQDHVLACARVHTEKLIAEAFARAVAATDDKALRETLSKLCDLYILSVIEEDRGWFQEHGRISSTRSKAVIKAVNQLCTEIRPAASDLVDAFGIPDEVLGAPIAIPGGPASQSSYMEFGDELPDAEQMIAELR
ncbi:acyl-CoA oxidase [Thermoleophilia bacterium SCSIO 60948]|nr:acyl-CoA oxidase [Thermoleophilia bacterium SCSIO 60948]